MDNINIGTKDELRRDLISGDWFIVGGDPEALEEFSNLVYPDIKVIIISEKPFKTKFWAKKTPLVKNTYDYHDWTSDLIMLEFYKKVHTGILSHATYIHNKNKIAENVENLLSKL